MTAYLCPVCGFKELTEPPEDFSVCPSCGTEFDYHDVGVSHEELRSLWIEEGARWFSPVRLAPQGWDPYVQLLRVGFISPYATLSVDSQTCDVVRVEPSPLVRRVRSTPMQLDDVSEYFAELQPV